MAIAALTLTVKGFLYGAGDGQVGSDMIGLRYFMPYTIDSNILGGVAALLLLAMNRNVPKWLAQMYLMATACLTLTMVITAGFLAPTTVMMGGSYFVMFSGDMFFFHFVNPVIAILTCTCLLNEHQFGKADCIIAMIPTIIYSFVYCLMVVILQRWEDFYNFTFGGKNEIVPIVIIVIYTMVYVIARVLTRAHNKSLK